MSRSPRKDRRKITVDGVVYRYCITPNDGYITLTARQENSRGQALWVAFHYHDEWVPTGAGASVSVGHRLILPRIVRLAILEGRRLGWDSSVTKPALFRMLDGDNLLPPGEWPRYQEQQSGDSHGGS